MRWERTHDDQWKAKLIAYNLEDCAALRRVTDFLHAACAEVPMHQMLLPRLPREGVAPQVARVQDLDKLANTERFGHINFAHPEFEFINNCAYFDYQRQRVFVRTNKTLKKHLRRPYLWRNRRIRASRRIEITASKSLFE